MSAHTTIRIGGSARFYVTCTKKDTLVRLVGALRYIDYPYKVIGGGSNLLVNDKGYNGVIIRPAFREIVENGCFVYADAGASLAAVARFARERGLGGLEFASGIPGTVGGAVYMNAGAHGNSMSGVVAMVDVLRDGKVVSLDVKACRFNYRTSIFQKKRDLIILGAYFFLTAADKAEIELTANAYLAKRKAAQPKQPNAGSIFRNPNSPLGKGGAAGGLIDDLGLKGYQIGGAAISEVHANFIVNLGGATARDVKRLIAYTKKRVRDAYGITLKAEIEIL